MALTELSGGQRYTYGDYLTWPDEFRAELVDGVVFVREPSAPVWIHQQIVGELHYQIRGALEGTDYRVCFAPLDVRLPKADEPDELVDTVLQPDLFIVCDRKKVDARGMRGAPDWVVEVLSPGTARHDRLVKVPVYERAGVREVWLVHPRDRTVTIYRRESGTSGGTDGYGPAIVLGLQGRMQLAAVPNISVDWDLLVKQLD
jgi:Uma2 family endonuclease